MNIKQKILRKIHDNIFLGGHAYEFHTGFCKCGKTINPIFLLDELTPFDRIIWIGEKTK